MHCTYLEVLGQILSQDRSEGESNIATHSHPDGGRVRGYDRRVKLGLIWVRTLSTLINKSFFNIE